MLENELIGSILLLMGYIGLVCKGCTYQQWTCQPARQQCPPACLLCSTTTFARDLVSSLYGTKLLNPHLAYSCLPFGPVFGARGRPGLSGRMNRNQQDSNSCENRQIVQSIRAGTDQGELVLFVGPAAARIAVRSVGVNPPLPPQVGRGWT